MHHRLLASSSLRHRSRGVYDPSTGFWMPLADARATLVLNGHDHDYQRWQPLDANGNPSATGLTEIVAGTGGHSRQSIMRSDPRVPTSTSNIFGALQLPLSTTT